MENKNIYVVGHKSPDTDSVVSAIAWAEYLCSIGYNANAASVGAINPETKFVLEKFGYSAPQLLEDAADKTLTLVDHNEASQSPDNVDKAKIIEVIDHHKINFQYEEPIIFSTHPLGSCATIIGERLLNADGFTVSKNLAGILLSAILSDTVIFKSPTTTSIDRNVAKSLAQIAQIENLEDFGIEIKKQKASIKGLDAQQAIRSDFKEFEVNGKKFGAGQIEVVDTAEIKERQEELLAALETETKTSGYLFAVLMVTNIIDQGTTLLAAGDTAVIEKAFNVKLENNSIYIPGMMSRKKDLIPPLMAALK